MGNSFYKKYTIPFSNNKINLTTPHGPGRVQSPILIW